MPTGKAKTGGKKSGAAKSPAPKVGAAQKEAVRRAELERQANQAKAKQEAERDVCWRWRSKCGTFGILRIRAGATDTEYLADVKSANCVELTKSEAPGRRITYTVFFGRSHVCGCEAWHRSAENPATMQKTCKHVEALIALRAAGRI